MKKKKVAQKTTQTADVQKINTLKIDKIKKLRSELTLVCSGTVNLWTEVRRLQCVRAANLQRE